MKPLSFIALILFYALNNISFCQSPGTLDLSYGTQGKIKYSTGLEELVIYQSVIKNTGSMVLTGKAKLAGGTNENIVVAVLKPNGTPDNSFNGTGYRIVDIQMTENAGKSLALQPDGKIVIAGWVHNGANFDICLIRLNSDGSFDTGFGTSGKIVLNLGSTEFGMAVDYLSDGKILVTARRYNGVNSDVALLRFLSNGVLDNSFGVNGISSKDFSNSNEIPYDSSVLPDGSILVVGDADQSGFSVFFAAKYSKDGVPVTNFGMNGFTTFQVGAGNNGVSTVKIQNDNEIVIGGYAYEGNETTLAVVRLNSDGTPDQSFGINGSVTTDIRQGSEYINDMIIQKDGKIIVCGVARGLISNADFTAVRYLPNGNTDLSFGANGIVTTDFDNTDVAASILSISDDKFFIVGHSDEKNLVLSRYHNDLQSSTMEVDEKFPITFYPNPAHSLLNITFYESCDGPVTVMLKNSAGSLVKELSISNFLGTTIQLDLPENLPFGIYYLLIKNKQHQITKKVVLH